MRRFILISACVAVFSSGVQADSADRFKGAAHDGYTCYMGVGILAYRVLGGAYDGYASHITVSIPVVVPTVGFVLTIR